MKILSTAFENNSSIPSKYTCEGQEINPPLEFRDVPEDTKSLVLIVDDPDAPIKTWIHW
ncbi:MAG: YbhB/YbcL family Raf kinase inhibitor-like protein, partial [Actinomycetia bacterium]|nr:YbhB/YbcL family Raf kinase inhibitor-like protein [Actinomycetes bacterium]